MVRVFIAWHGFSPAEGNGKTLLDNQTKKMLVTYYPYLEARQRIDRVCLSHLFCWSFIGVHMRDLWSRLWPLLRVYIQNSKNFVRIGPLFFSQL